MMLEENKKIIKEDINFLEYPNWVIGQRNGATIFKIEKPHGKYEMISPLGLPKHVDKIVLYALIHKLYREKKLKSYVLNTVRYEIAKDVFPGLKSFGKNKYSRIMQALKKWTALSIEFDGLFYGDERSIRYFHILDEVVFRPKSGELMIKFNESYVTQLRETKFYKLIDFEQYRKLSRTASARLYEVLVKSFKNRNEWAINIQSLAEKLTFEKREKAHVYYPSDVLRHLNPAVKEINKKTDLQIEFSYNKETGVCIFNKLAKKKIALKPATKITEGKSKIDYKQQMVECYAYFKSLSVEEQKIILDDIKWRDFLKCVPEKDARIFAYMTQIKQWQSKL